MNDGWKDDERRRAAHDARLSPLDDRGVRWARVRMIGFLVFEVVAFALGQWLLAVAMLVPLGAQLSWWSPVQRHQVLFLRA